jgi:hypothetical protein
MLMLMMTMMITVTSSHRHRRLHRNTWLTAWIRGDGVACMQAVCRIHQDGREDQPPSYFQLPSCIVPSLSHIQFEENDLVVMYSSFTFGPSQPQFSSSCARTLSHSNATQARCSVSDPSAPSPLHSRTRQLRLLGICFCCCVSL